MGFLAENREKIISTLPKDHKMVDIAKAAGAQWKALSDAVKKPYEVKFKAKQAEFVKAMEEYKKAHPDVANEQEDDDEEEGEEEEQQEKPKPKTEVAPKKKARKAGA